MVFLLYLTLCVLVCVVYIVVLMINHHILLLLLYLRFLLLLKVLWLVMSHSTVCMVSHFCCKVLVVVVWTTVSFILLLLLLLKILFVFSDTSHNTARDCCLHSGIRIYVVVIVVVLNIFCTHILYFHLECVNARYSTYFVYELLSISELHLVQLQC